MVIRKKTRAQGSQERLLKLLFPDLLPKTRTKALIRPDLSSKEEETELLAQIASLAAGLAMNSEERQERIATISFF